MFKRRLLGGMDRSVDVIQNPSLVMKLSVTVRYSGLSVNYIALQTGVSTNRDNWLIWKGTMRFEWSSAGLCYTSWVSAVCMSLHCIKLVMCRISRPGPGTVSLSLLVLEFLVLIELELHQVTTIFLLFVFALAAKILPWRPTKTKRYQRKHWVDCYWQ